MSNSNTSDDGARPGRFDPRDPAAPWDHADADVGEVRLHYVAAGPADGELVVLLHGFPEFWYTWRHLLPALADAGYRAVAPDMRGYNRSDAPDGVDAYSLEPLSADVAGLVDALEYESAHVVGHDWGGIVAWALASRRPATVDRLGICNAPHPALFAREIRTNSDQRERSSYIAGFLAAEEPERGLTQDDCRRVADVHADATDPGAYTDRELEHFRAAFCEQTDPTAALHYYRAAFALDESGTLTGTMDAAPVSVPTLVCWGERDPALSTALLDGIDEVAPDCRVERFPGASHWVHADEPGPVRDRLLDWLGTGE